MKLLTTITLCLLTSCVALAGEPTNGITLWGLSADDADALLVGRLGYEQDLIEVGGTLKWLTSNPEWGPVPDAAGAYLLFHLVQQVKVESPSPPDWLEEFLNSLKARPYAGLEIIAPVRGEQRQIQPNWIAGSLFSTDPEYKSSLVIEYTSGDSVVNQEDDWVITLGVRLLFK